MILLSYFLDKKYKVTWKQQKKLHRVPPPPQLDKVIVLCTIFKQSWLCFHKSNYARLEAFAKTAGGSLKDRIPRQQGQHGKKPCLTKPRNVTKLSRIPPLSQTSFWIIWLNSGRYYPILDNLEHNQAHLTHPRNCLFYPFLNLCAQIAGLHCWHSSQICGLQIFVSTWFLHASW